MADVICRRRGSRRELGNRHPMPSSGPELLDLSGIVLEGVTAGVANKWPLLNGCELELLLLICVGLSPLV